MALQGSGFNIKFMFDTKYCKINMNINLNLTIHFLMDYEFNNLNVYKLLLFSTIILVARNYLLICKILNIYFFKICSVKFNYILDSFI